MPSVPVGGQRDRFLGDRRDAAPIDVLHREDVNAGAAHGGLLALVEVADADEHGLRRPHLRREAADGRRARAGVPPRSAASGIPCTLPLSVVSGVFMSPCASTQIRPSGLPCCRANADGGGDRTGGDAVIAAEHDRQAVALEHGERALVERAADGGDLRQILLLRIARVDGLLRRRIDVAVVAHLVAERAQPIGNSGNAHRRRPHVDAATAAAQIERSADDVQRAHDGG